jgi:putative glycosyltransferase (TIGR04372 family)
MKIISISRRIANKIILLPRFLISIPGSVILLIFGYRIIRPSCDCTRIGHLLCEIDCLVKEIQLGIKKQRKYLIFYEARRVANKAFLELLPEYIQAYGFSRTSFNLVNRLFYSRISSEPVGQYAVAMYETAEIYSINSRWGVKRPVFKPLSKWDSDRKLLFQKWGIPVECPYVCIHAREGNYSPSDEHYHSHRNVDVESYKTAVFNLVAKGVAVIRMGDPTMKPLGNWGSMVFDYASSDDRAPWLDLAISADCLFFLAGSSGAFYMATIFGRPVACVGMALPFNFSPSGRYQDIGIPKLFRHKVTKEILSFNEIFELGLSELRLAEEIDRSDYELVENSPNEITELAEEMYLRQTNAWIDTPEDLVLQQKMRTLLRPGSYSYGTSSRCGAMFLRRYKSLFQTELRQAA